MFAATELFSGSNGMHFKAYDIQPFSPLFNLILPLLHNYYAAKVAYI